MKKNKEILENDEMSTHEVLNDAAELPNAEPQESEESKVESLETRIAELEDKNLRMMAEFDN